MVPPLICTHRLYCTALLLTLHMAIVVGSVSADQVVVGTENYPSARIVGMEAGRLRFLTAAGELKKPWISDVQWMIVDRGGAFVDFNQAERLVASGSPGRAIERYRRAIRLGRDFWTELMEARLLAACLQAGRLKQAAQIFVRVVNGDASGAGVAARLMPETIPAKATRETQAAVQVLDAAVGQSTSDDSKALFHLLRYHILERTGDPRAEAAATAVTALAVPAPARTQEVYRIQLKAIGQMLGQAPRSGAWISAWDSLDRAIGSCPESILGSFLLLKARTQLSRASTKDEIIRAGWSFMRVAIHLRDDPQAPDALQGAAEVMEKLSRPHKAISLLQECLAHQRVTDDLRMRCEAELARLRSGGKP